MIANLMMQMFNPANNGNERNALGSEFGLGLSARKGEVQEQESLAFKYILSKRLEPFSENTNDLFSGKDVADMQESVLPLLTTISLPNQFFVPVVPDDPNPLQREGNQNMDASMLDRNALVKRQAQPNNTTFALLSKISTVLKQISYQWNPEELASEESNIFTVGELKNIVLASRNEPDFFSNFENQDVSVGKVLELLPTEFAERMELPLDRIKPKPILLATPRENMPTHYRLYPAFLWRIGSSEAFAAVEASTPFLETQIIDSNGVAVASNEILFIAQQKPFSASSGIEDGAKMQRISEGVNLQWIEIQYKQAENEAKSSLPHYIARPLPSSMLSSGREAQVWQKLLFEWNQTLRQIFSEQHQSGAVDLAYSDVQESDNVKPGNLAGSVKQTLQTSPPRSLWPMTLNEVSGENSLVAGNSARVNLRQTLYRDATDTLKPSVKAAPESMPSALPVSYAKQGDPSFLSNNGKTGKPSGNRLQGSPEIKNSVQGQSQSDKFEASVANRTVNQTVSMEPYQESFGLPHHKSGKQGSTIPGQAMVRQVERMFFQRQQVLTFKNLEHQIRSQINQDVSTIRIRLKPERLGQITMKLDMQAGQLSAKIWVQTNEVKQLLESNIDQLKETLLEKGLNAERLEIRLAQSFQTNPKNENANQKFEQPADQDKHAKHDQRNSQSKDRRQGKKSDFQQFF